MTSRLRHDERAKLLAVVNQQRAREKPPLPPKRRFEWKRGKRRVPKPTRRMVGCAGVRAVRKLAAEQCSRLVVQRGQRRVRCGSCHVLQVWRERFGWASVEVVIGVLEKLRAQGRI